MKKRKWTGIACLAVLAFGISTAQAEVLRYGVGGNTWSSFGIADNTDTGTGGLNLNVTQDGITFTLNVVSTADSGGELQLNGNGSLIPATGGNQWENADGTLVFKLSISDPTSQLDTLKVGNIDVSAWNAVDEDMAFTAFGTTVTKDATSGGVSSGAIAYDTLGLTQLSTGNIGTWSLEIDMVDTGGVSGLEYLEFEYTVIPEPATLGLLAATGGSILFIRRRIMM